jgi:DNA-binding response OmpR family regulator
MLNRTSDSVAIFGEDGPANTVERELTLDGYGVHRYADLGECADPVEFVIVIAGSGPARGLSVLYDLRRGAAATAGPAVLTLWVAGDEEQATVLRAFDAGADDVLRFPWEYPELLARLRSLGRRGSARRLQLAHGGLVIDVAAREATYASTSLRLTRLEFELLAHLARDPHHVHSREELMSHVWGYRDSATSRTLDSHISRLRRALRDAGAQGLLVNVRGVGYRLAADRAGADR